MKHIELAQEIATLYPAIYQRLHARWEKHEHRPAPETLAVLTHLELSGPLTVTEAARHFKRAQSAMSELIDRLQAHSYVDRIRDARDRRRILVWITEAGLDSLKRSRQVLDVNLLAQSIERMSPQDRHCLVDGLRALVTAAAAKETTKRSKP
ncbi:MAG: MarR family transcriptional regulator [Gammaproteobacteria bacterium]|nr:MarR family transcriptional regulator [Gammaproteobacteria bacterium]